MLSSEQMNLGSIKGQIQERARDYSRLAVETANQKILVLKTKISERVPREVLEKAEKLKAQFRK